MNKKQGLTAAFKPIDRSTKPEKPPAKTPAASQPPSRRQKKAMIGYFDPAVSKQVRFIALAEDTTVQGLLGEALNLLFAKYEKPEIA